MAEGPRWANERWAGKGPGRKGFMCAHCRLREPDRNLGEGTVISGAELGICRVYQKGKPHGIVWDGEECLYFMQERD